jgi:hypothetical protein
MKRLTLASLALALLLTAGSSLIPAPADAAVISACVEHGNGRIYVLGANESCKKHDRAIQLRTGGGNGGGGNGGGGITSLNQLAGLPCTTIDGQQTTTKLLPSGPFLMLACAVAQSERFFDLGLTIYDVRTGLQWEKKVPGAGCLHCVDDVYTFCTATGNGGAGSVAGCAANTESWIGEVNASAFAGHSDWRVPSMNEIRTFLVPGIGACAGDPVVGPNAPTEYWTREVPTQSQGCTSGGGSSALSLFPVRAVRTGNGF